MLKLASGLLAPVLCVAFALFHLVQVRSERVSPWKGGSFGMFSTLDLDYHRRFHLELVTAAGKRPVQLDARFKDVIPGLVTQPTPDLLQSAGNLLAGYQWAEGPSGILALSPSQAVPPNVKVLDVNGLSLSVWRYSYDPEPSLASWVPIESVEVPVP